jgi:uncharacterized protein YegP (UPF0339 family)
MYEWQIVHKVSTGQYHARFVAPNGRIIFWTENYHNHGDAVAAINLVKVNGPAAGIVNKLVQ